KYFNARHYLFGLSPKYAFSTMLPDWSLSLEMQFYAVFPVLALAMRRFGWLVTCIALTGVSVVGSWAIGRSVVFPEPSLLIFKLPVFMAGITLYVSSRSTYLLTRWLGLCLGLILVLPLAHMAPAVPQGNLSHIVALAWMTTPLVLLVALIAALLAGADRS